MVLAPIDILLIAEDSREEFVQPLAELCQRGNVFSCKTPREATDYLADVSCPPPLIVIAQSRPGQYVHAELDRLLQLAPLARIVLLLGSWCEGETRTGQIWSGAARVFWYEWPGELARNLPVMASGRFAPWLAPVTVLEEERNLFEPVTSLPSNSGLSRTGAPLVLVCTRRSSFGDALCAACRQPGYSALWQRPDRLEKIPGVGAIIWEGIQLLPAEAAELKNLSTRWPQTPIIALADFPRLETRELALAAGAVAVLPKPCSLADLLALLNRLCPLPLAEGVQAASEVA